MYNLLIANAYTYTYTYICIYWWKEIVDALSIQKLATGDAPDRCDIFNFIETLVAARWWLEIWLKIVTKVCHVSSFQMEAFALG